MLTLPSSLARTAAGIGRFVTLSPPVDPGRFALSLRLARRTPRLSQPCLAATNHRRRSDGYVIGD